MIIYKCLITGDEMFSDTYKIITTEDGLLEVEGKYITRRVGEIDDKLIGGNASAEQACEGTDVAMETGPDIMLNHQLGYTAKFTKQTFQVYLKDYFKRLKGKIADQHPDCPEKIEEFQCEARKAAVKLLSLIKEKHKDLDFITGGSGDVDGIVGILDTRDDGTPYITFIKCGLECEKC